MVALVCNPGWFIYKHEAVYRVFVKCSFQNLCEGWINTGSWEEDFGERRVDNERCNTSGTSFTSQTFSAPSPSACTECVFWSVGCVVWHGFLISQSHCVWVCVCMHSFCFATSIHLEEVFFFSSLFSCEMSASDLHCYESAAWKGGLEQQADLDCRGKFQLTKREPSQEWDQNRFAHTRRDEAAACERHFKVSVLLKN